MNGTLLYDGDCRICTTTVGWLHRHATSSAHVVPWQYADLPTLGLGSDDCNETVQWVQDGRRAVGPDAVAAYLSTSSDGWQTAARVLTAPASRQVSWPLYRFVSQHRTHLPGGTPASQLPRVATRVPGIRRRRPRDLAACARLLRIVHFEAHYPVRWPEHPRAWLDGDDVLGAWVAQREGEILGHAAFSSVGTRGSSVLHWREVTGREPATLAAVTRLFVRPRVQGGGVGAALLDVVLADIRARGLTPVAEVVGPNGDARRLFERQGWRLRSMDAWREDRRHRLYCYEGPR